MTAHAQGAQASEVPTEVRSLPVKGYMPRIKELRGQAQGGAKSRPIRATPERVDAFVHANPFGAAAIAASIGVLLGLAISSIFSSSLPGDSTTHAPRPDQGRPPPQPRRKVKKR